MGRRPSCRLLGQAPKVHERVGPSRGAPGWGLHLPGPPRRRSGQQMFSKAPLPSGLADEMLLATIAFLIGSE